MANQLTTKNTLELTRPTYGGSYRLVTSDHPKSSISITGVEDESLKHFGRTFFFEVNLSIEMIDLDNIDWSVFTKIQEIIERKMNSLRSSTRESSPEFFKNRRNEAIKETTRELELLTKIQAAKG
ncbi:hypothetical protein [Photobacterium kishitanii]|uniref:Uncharacterized protein n=1 Tax=Photobacterium kishitanii TaxID=318456 RepID=A0A2T3KLM0_9GAMM|nr:hypothetical protein [Photobacterium kishitanii]PSV00553.1 hypothetical protein C9J27_05305 [Photobacterium kishitanii]